LLRLTPLLDADCIRGIANNFTLGVETAGPLTLDRSAGLVEQADSPSKIASRQLRLTKADQGSAGRPKIEESVARDFEG